MAHINYQYFNNVFTFITAPVSNYYLILKYYNAIETRSSVPVSFAANINYYEFINMQNSAFGGNMIQKGERWCIFNGDTKQEGIIDLDDMQQIDNDAYNFVQQQPYISDLNGGNIVDITDIVIADKNAFNFVSSVTQ